MHRRGDNIPSISAYAHWNEEAEAMWYAENRYDMEHADEIIEDENDFIDDEEEDFEEKVFVTEAEAKEFMDRPQDWGLSFKNSNLKHYANSDEWIVEYW